MSFPRKSRPRLAAIMRISLMGLLAGAGQVWSPGRTEGGRARGPRLATRRRRPMLVPEL